MLIDGAISRVRNVNEKEAEKILKYKDLAIEIQSMWNVKARVIPVVIGATGTISKSFRKYVSNIPGNHDVKGTTENSHIGHCTHTAESASVKQQKSQRRN
jgi:hypothetical protein